MKVFRRLLLIEWSGLAAAIFIGASALAFIAPNFLTAFNLYVMLRSLCVGLLVAFAQMITLGVGQMNVAVGAIGGLAAVVLGGAMEVFGIPIALAVPLAVTIGAVGGLINGVLTVRTGINAFIITLATGSAFTGINFGITGSIPFYEMPPALTAFGSGHFGPFPYLIVAPLIVAALLGVFFARTAAGRRLLAFGGNPNAAELSGISSEWVVVSAHCSVRPAGSGRRRARGCAAGIGPAHHRFGLAAPFLRRADHRGRRIDWRIYLGARHDVRGPSHRTYRKRHGAGQGRSLLGSIRRSAS